MTAHDRDIKRIGSGRSKRLLAVVGLAFLLLPLSCIGFRGRKGTDLFMEKGIKTDKWAPLVQIEDNQWLLFGFRLSGGRPLNELLQTVSESNGCTALSNIEVLSQIRWPIMMIVINRQTTVYARCVGGKKVVRPKPKPKEEPAEEEAYEE